MDTNFREKIDYIEKLYKSWLYRKLTPLGKITIIKTLALSQFSHIALVCPHLGQEKAKLVDKLSYNFLWSNKPDRMKRTEAVLPINQGGLNMPQVGHFWESLKFSWFRRLIGYSGAWFMIFQANLLACGVEVNELLYSGPDSMKICATRLTNEFWREVLEIGAKMMTKILHYKPYYFFHLNLFDNEMIKYGNNMIRKYDFPRLWSKNIVQIGDLYDCSERPPRFLDRLELNSRYFLSLDFLRFQQLRSAVLKVSIKFGVNQFSDVFRPRLPLLFKISLEQPKGCKFFYNVLTNNSTIRLTSRGENKWHEKLETIYTIVVCIRFGRLSTQSENYSDEQRHFYLFNIFDDS